MAEKLGIAGALQRPTTSIMFGDATSKSPLGVFKNYHLKIGECIIQTDLTVMEWKKRRIYLCYWEPHSLPRGSDFCATIDSTTLSSKSHGATKVVKERVDKEPRVGKDKVREDQGLRSHVLRGLELRNHVLIGHELIDLFKPLVCLMKRAFKLCLMSH
ncbi:unnamed protein product [Microthlaspi erraticum]|uniref:Uncharacterized protein n=1 Tax=Microthlaspi erraticum TaxID=1685480 RepID=A0A6D2L273_9BRAS|nr:unnamed protein product [Microthlaspi erraticum]